MSFSKASTKATLWLAMASASAMILQSPAAFAQPDSYSSDVAPPSGEYAPPPGDEANVDTYDARAQDYDAEYSQRYSEWAAANCVQEHNNNVAAGAVIGGVLGAVIGSNVAGRHDRTAGAIVGGALGATTGAAIGSSASSSNCPPGYVVRGGAPAFYYGGGYGPAYIYGPSWYRPWVWAGGRWVFHPYRYWYWNHRTYWHPGRHYRPWKWRHRRW